MRFRRSIRLGGRIRSCLSGRRRGCTRFWKRRRRIKSAAAGSNEQKIGDYYASCMDTKAIDANGYKPIDAYLQKIAAMHDGASLLETTARLQEQGTGVLFAYGSDQDFADSTQVIGEVRQGGLGLPDRDYYTRDDEKSKEIRKQYVEHMTKMFVLMGDAKEKAAAEAQTVLNIETSLAKASLNNVELRDPQKNYHMMPLADAQKLTPKWNWDAYFRAIGSPQIAKMNVAQPEFLKAMDGLLTSVPMEDWKTYYRWQLIHRSARLLSDPFVKENFDFEGRVLQGTKEMRVRWRRCSAAVDDGLPRGAGADICGEIFSAGGEGARAGDGAQLTGRVARRFEGAGVDEPGDAEGGRRKAPGVCAEDRISGQVARLFEAEDRSRVVCGECVSLDGV